MAMIVVMISISVRYNINTLLMIITEPIMIVLSVVLFPTTICVRIPLMVIIHMIAKFPVEVLDILMITGISRFFMKIMMHPSITKTSTIVTTTWGRSTKRASDLTRKLLYHIAYHILDMFTNLITSNLFTLSVIHL